jgi:hypothetical protein
MDGDLQPAANDVLADRFLNDRLEHTVEVVGRNRCDGSNVLQRQFAGDMFVYIIDSVINNDSMLMQQIRIFQSHSYAFLQ